MRNGFKKVLALTLCLALSVSIMSPTFAAENDASQTSPVKLTVQPIVFNVEVPTGLPVDVDSKGNVTVATDAKITNNSAAPIVIAGVQVNPITDWNIVPMNKDFKGSRIGTKEFGFVLNNDEVPASGAMTLTKANWPSVNGVSILPLSYDSIVAPQKDAIEGSKIADVVFTIGWDVNDFTLSSETLSIEKGGSSKLNLLGVDSAVWTSSNEAVATVDQTGLVTPLDWGTTTITATANGVSKTCEVTVPKVLQELTIIGPEESTLSQKTTVQMSTTSKYRSTTLWESSNPAVATVDSNGLVTTVSEGTTTITATIGGISATYPLTVDKYVLATDEDFRGEADGSFKYIGTEEYVEIPYVIKGVPVTSYKGMFINTSVKGVKSTNTNVTNMQAMFQDSKAITLDLSSFDTSNVMDMGEMFKGSLISEIKGLNSFDTSNVTNMNYMFASSQVTNLDLSSFNTSNVTSMSYMFNYSQAISLDLKSFDTSNVTNMTAMLASSKATSIDLSNFNTSNVTDMSRMFASSQVSNLDLSSFNTSSVTNMFWMFSGSQATSLNLSSFDTSNVINMGNMFANSKAAILDLSNFDVSKASMIDAFMNAQATKGYARTKTDVDRFNKLPTKPSTLTFVLKPVS